MESDEEGGPVKHHTLPWKKMEITNLIKAIDERFPRVVLYGEPSTREPCEHTFSFCKEEALLALQVIEQ